jgi:hypothetical protein
VVVIKDTTTTRARLNAVTAAKFKKQAGSHGIDVQPQGRPVVGGDLAPALISYNATCFGRSVEENHQSVCTELQQRWRLQKTQERLLHTTTKKDQR